MALPVRRSLRGSRRLRALAGERGRLRGSALPRRHRPGDRPRRGPAHLHADRARARGDRDRQHPVRPPSRAHARRDGGDLPPGPPCLRRPRLSPLRVEVQRRERALQARRPPLRLPLRGRVPAAHGGQGREPRHGLVRHARPGLAPATGAPSSAGSTRRISTPAGRQRLSLADLNGDGAGRGRPVPPARRHGRSAPPLSTCNGAAYAPNRAHPRRGAVAAQGGLRRISFGSAEVWLAEGWRQARRRADPGAPSGPSADLEHRDRAGERKSRASVAGCSRQRRRGRAGSACERCGCTPARN